MAYSLKPRQLGPQDMNLRTQMKRRSSYQAGRPVPYKNYAPTPASAPPGAAPGTAARQPAGAAPSTGTPAGAAPTVQQAYDASTDPILQQIRALSGKGRAAAESGAASARKQLAISYGDDQLARQYGDESTATAAKNNPFSVAAELARSFQRNNEGIVENMNKRNLFYSGARGKAHSRETEDYQRGTFRAESEKQQRLSAIQAELMQLLQGYDQQDIEGLQGAYGRASDRAVEYGIDPGAGASGAAGAAPALNGAPPQEITDYGYGPSNGYQDMNIPPEMLEEILAGRPIRTPRPVAI